MFAIFLFIQTVSESLRDASGVDDTALIERVRQRDETALSELYGLYSSSVYGMTMRVLRNKSLAEDATQDTFMKVWNEADKFDPKRGRLRSWILTIARYTAIDRLRREKRQSPWVSIGLEETLNVLSHPKTSEAMDKADSRLLKQLIAELPSEQTEAIDLAFFQGMSHREIAKQLNQPLGTVKSRIRDGLQTLRRLWLLEAE